MKQEIINLNLMDKRLSVLTETDDGETPEQTMRAVDSTKVS